MFEYSVIVGTVRGAESTACRVQSRPSMMIGDDEDGDEDDERQAVTSKGLCLFLIMLLLLLH